MSQSSSSSHCIVGAVVVTFNPEFEGLRELLQSLITQVSEVIVVDNTEGATHPELVELVADFQLQIVIKLIRLGKNLGLAKALNVGIQACLDRGVDFVLLSDQDSLPQVHMVNALLDAYDDLCATGEKVAVVGPSFTDTQRSIAPGFAVEYSKWFYTYERVKEGEDYIKVLTLITSGKLVPAAVFKDVGLMREDLFIDKIDLEWCFRAIQKGYSVWGVKHAKMLHKLGDSELMFWFLGSRKVNLYSPLRLYYQARNLVVLCKQAYIPVAWKIRQTASMLKVFFAHLFCDEKLEVVKHVLLGFWHGAVGKLGKLRK